MKKPRPRQQTIDEIDEEPDEPKEDAGYGDKPKKKSKKDSDTDDDFHKEALEAYEQGYNRDRDNQDEAYQDLKFLAGEPAAHWDPTAMQQRADEGRPTLIVNQGPQFVRQVTGDMRQTKPAIKIVPVDDTASKEVAAKVLPGLVRYVELRSDASGIYFGAADQQVGGGIGHWMVTHEYAAGTTYNQEIRIIPVPDGIAVVWDADSILPTREDAMHCFVPYDMSAKAFKKKYPDASADPLQGSPECFTSWFTDDHIRVAIYFCKVETKKRLAMYPGGQIDDVTDDKKAEAEAVRLGAEVEERPGFKVKRSVISASGVLEEPEEWPGPDIPVIPLIGEEVIIGRQVIRRGVIRVLRDVQRIYNYTISTKTEVIALQPKSPFIGTHEQFEKYADQWESANSRNWPYLEYTHQANVPPPQRSSPAVSTAGLDNLLVDTQAAMNATTGIYPSALGAKSNETSGKAIIARQREGDTGTFVYLDNFGRAIRRTGQIIVNMAPYIYDTARTIQIVGEDGKLDQIKINQKDLAPDAQEHIEINDITNGAYEVSIEMGPSYSTKREEARDGMSQMLQSLGPQAAPMFMDLFVKAQDWPLADKIAARAKLLLPPQIQQAEAAEAGEDPPPPQPPPPPTPEQQQAMELEQEKKNEAQQKNIELARKNELDDKRLKVDMQKLDLDAQKIQAEMAKLQVEQQAMAMQANGEQQPVEDPRVDELAQAVEKLTEMIMEVAHAVGQTKLETKDAIAKIPKPEAPPSAPDHTPAFLDLISKFAGGKPPAGTEPPPSGMEALVPSAGQQPPPA